MDENKKTDAPKPSPGLGGAQGSGSDTVSAARTATGAVPGGTAGTGAAGGGSAQSGTLASHTSRPMGGTGGTGAGQTAGSHLGQTGGTQTGAGQSRPGGQGGPQHAAGGGSGQGSQTGDLTEQARQAAGAAAQTVRETAEQVQERAGEAYEKATDWARDAYDQVSDWASDQYERGSRQFGDVRRRSTQGMRGSGQSVQQFVSENPVLVGVIGLAAGLLLGALIPRSRREDEYLGRWSDEVRTQGMRYARDLTQRGREFVEQTLGDEDDAFATPMNERRTDEHTGERIGPSGRYQNH